MTEQNSKCAPCQEEDNWEEQEQNKELRKVAPDKKVEAIKKSDIVKQKKYEHIEKTISVIDKLRIALREITHAN